MKVLVTGGSRGIGKAIVEKFRSQGHFVTAPSRSELDLSKKPLLPSVDFDIVINNAGINPLNGILDISEEEVMRVNYTSHLEIVQQCLPYMIDQKFGRIVNIGSIWIDLAKPKRLAYNASKSALNSLTKSITAEYAAYNIIANTVSPGFIATELTYQNNSKEDLDSIIKGIPINRLGYPEEVAELVYNLCIDNNYIAGQNIKIDGGYSCAAKC
jgi:3-oxoacyl-[acyl-carrier protein] reductase